MGKLFDFFNEGFDWAKENSAAILSVGACFGIVGTIVLSVNAGKKIEVKTQQIDKEIEEKKATGTEITVKEEKKEHIKAYFPTILPAVGIGAMSIACTIASYKISAKKIAALTTAYTLTSKAFAEYKKAAEKLLGDKEQEIQRERLKNKVKEEPMDKEMEEKVKADYERAEKNPSSADLLYGIKPVFKDDVTGQYMYATRDQIRDALEEYNVEIRTSDDYDWHPWNNFLINIPGADYNTETGESIGFYKADYPDGIKLDLSNSTLSESGLNIIELAIKGHKYNVKGLINRDKQCGDGIWYGR